MRLIDEKTTCDLTGNYKEIDGEIYIKLSDVEKCLDNAPVAYDIHKVMRQLEEMKKKPMELQYDVPLIEATIRAVKSGIK